MEYKNLEKTKFFENYKKALTGVSVLKYEPTKSKNEIFTCGSCGKILFEQKEDKYIFDNKTNATFLKEIRIKCQCGKVNTIKRS
ncbi:MAG: hypothetical protein ACRCYM_02695 [Cetobacterium sp.]